MEEILHQLGYTKPRKYWDIFHINWCRISSINRILMYLGTEDELSERRLLDLLVLVGLYAFLVAMETYAVGICHYEQSVVKFVTYVRSNKQKPLGVWHLYS